MSIRDHLVDDVHEWKRWWSMRWLIVSTFCSTAAVACPAIPADWSDSLPHWTKGALAAGAMVSGGAAAVSRVIKQAPAPVAPVAVTVPAPASTDNSEHA